MFSYYQGLIVHLKSGQYKKQRIVINSKLQLEDQKYKSLCVEMEVLKSKQVPEN